jgi:hypothetical protein
VRLQNQQLRVTHPWITNVPRADGMCVLAST